MFIDWDTQYISDTDFFQIDPYSECNPINIATSFFIWLAVLKFVWQCKGQKNKIVQSEKRKKVGGLMLLYFKTYYKIQ